MGFFTVQTFANMGILDIVLYHNSDENKTKQIWTEWTIDLAFEMFQALQGLCNIVV